MSWPLDNLGPYGQGADWKNQGGIDKVFEEKYGDGRQDQAVQDFIIAGGAVIALSSAFVWKKFIGDSTTLTDDLILENGGIIPAGKRIRNIKLEGNNVTFTCDLRSKYTVPLKSYMQATESFE